MADDTNTAEREAAYDMIDRFLRNNLSSDEDYAEYSKALDLVLSPSLAASAIETKRYADGTTATGIGPLPKHSPSVQHALRVLTDVESMLGGANGPTIQIRAVLESLAASAGSEPEPFGHWFTDDPKSFAMPGSGFLLGKEPPKDAINVIPLYTHPSPPEGMAGWISVDERLPESGTPVLLDIGKKYPFRAMWAPAKTLEASNDSDAVGDYDEATDTYYCPEGWYEWNPHEKTHWFVTETPRAWMPLPASEAKEL